MNWLRFPLAAALAALIPFASADPLGTAITYQGHLYDNNAPAQNLYDMRFKLFDDPDDGQGTQLGDVLKESVPVENGQFTVEIDFGANAFNGQARWLEIYVGPENAAQLVKLDERQALKAAPEALHARSVTWSGITGVPASIANGTQVFGTAGVIATTNATGQVNVYIDEEYTQRRIVGSCPGSAIQSVAKNGIVVCATPANTPTAPGSHSVTIADNSNLDRAPRMILLPSGFPLIAHTERDGVKSAPRVTACNDPACAGADEASRGMQIMNNDADQQTFATSALSSTGEVFFAWQAQSGNGAVLRHCDPQDCSSSNTMGGFVLGGTITDLGIAATSSGVVFALHTAAGLRLGHCPAGNCVGQTTVQVASLPTESPGSHPVFAIDAHLGLPTLASIDALTGTLWVIRCNDTACADNDETVNKVGIGGPPITVRTDALAMTLRDGLNPVIAAFTANGNRIAIISCNDPACEGNDETQHLSLGANTGGGLGVIVGNDGLPAISFADTVDGAVKFAKCQSDDCSTMSPWVTVDDRNTVIDGLDMVLGADGNPLIAYSDSNAGALRVVKCANRSCQ